MLPLAREGCDVNETQLLHHALAVGGLLFAIGLVGFLSRRNMIVMFLAAEMMLQGVSLSLVAWGRFHNDWGGQMLVILILTVAACEAALALALVLVIYQHHGTLDIAFLQKLREDVLPPFVDRELPHEREAPHPVFPKLTPAGIRPTVSEDELVHRSHV